MIWNLCEGKQEIMSAHQNRGANYITFTSTTTPTPRLMLLLLLLHEQRKETFNKQRHTNKYVYVLMDGLSYSIHTVYNMLPFGTFRGWYYPTARQ